jgi:hypothetical protein
VETGIQRIFAKSLWKRVEVFHIGGRIKKCAMTRTKGPFPQFPRPLLLLLKNNKYIYLKKSEIRGPWGASVENLCGKTLGRKERSYVSVLL